MSTKWNDNSWQQEFVKMKRHTSDVKRLLMDGPRGFTEAWQLGVLHEEYKRLKKKYQQFEEEEEKQKNSKDDKNV